jgi:hypothetical protein
MATDGHIGRAVDSAGAGVAGRVAADPSGQAAWPCGGARPGPVPRGRPSRGPGVAAAAGRGRTLASPATESAPAPRGGRAGHTCHGGRERLPCGVWDSGRGRGLHPTPKIEERIAARPEASAAIPKPITAAFTVRLAASISEGSPKAQR